jgi:uncharacterized protein YoxC
MEGARTSRLNRLVRYLAQSRVRRLLETDLDKKDRTTKLFQFFFPWVFLLTFAITSVLFLWAWKGWDVAQRLVDIWIFYTLPPAGKETIIPKAVAGEVPAWIAGPATSIVDISVSMFLIWNYDWVKKIPFFGPALQRAEEKGRKKIEKARWFKRMSFVFCTFVVFVPFSGSGGFGGTIFGRVLGMHPYRVLLAVAIGSFIGSTGFAILSERLVQFLEGTPFIEFLNNLNMIQIVVVIIAIGFLIYAIRNPRMAAIKTTRAVSSAIDVTEKAFVQVEKKRKDITTKTVKRTKDTLTAVGEVNRAFAEINMEVVTRPMEALGHPGRKLARSTRDLTRKTVDETHKVAGKVIEQTIDISEKATSWTAETVSDLTMGGIDQTRKGWNEAGKVIIKGGEGIEKLVKKKPPIEDPPKEE